MNRFCVRIMALIAVLASPLVMAAPTLEIGRVDGHPGNTIEVPVTFENDGNVSGVQFSVSYDTNVLSDQGTAGGTDIVGAIFKAGTKAVLIVRFGGSPLNNGEVAVLYLQIAPDARPGTYTISPVNVLFSDSAGNKIPASPAPAAGTVTVR